MVCSTFCYYNGHTEILRELVANDASINLQTNTGASALFLSSRKGHNSVVEVLLSYGAC